MKQTPYERRRQPITMHIVERDDPEAMLARKDIRRAGYLLYAVAGLCLLDRVIDLLHLPLPFPVGLSISHWLANLTLSWGIWSNLLTWPINLALAAGFAFAARKGHRGNRWFFLGGLIFYAIDGLLVFVSGIQDPIAILGLLAVHGGIGHVIYKGFRSFFYKRTPRLPEP